MSSGSGAGNSSRPNASEIGIPFGRFRLLDKIGAGDIADVYRAVASGVQGFERRIAIKLMQTEVREQQPGGLFAEEARVSAMLDHPGIVQVYEFGVIGDAPFIAMEYLRGKNLDETMKALRAQGECLSPSLALFIAHQVAAALAHAHRREDQHGRPLRLVHGEVIPANIMLVREGAVKLLDFGAAALARDPRYTVTRRGSPLPRHASYLAPEQVAGTSADERSDVFSLGVVLWEMLTGQRLFTGGSDRRTLANVARAAVTPPSRSAAGIPPELDRLVMAALAREPGQRLASARAFADELEEVARLIPGRHGDLTALLERMWGSPRDTGPVRTLAGQTGALPPPLPPPSRPELARTTPRPTAAPPARPGEEGAPITRLAGDTTMAALQGRAPARRAPAPKGLGNPRTLLLVGAALVSGFVVTSAILTGRSHLTAFARDPNPARLAPTPVAAAPAAPAPRVAAASPDAGSAAPASNPATPRAQASAEPRTFRPARRAKAAPLAATYSRPVRRGLEDRRPNPFGE